MSPIDTEMESTQKSDTISQTSSNSKNVQSKSTSRGVGWTGSHPASSTSHHPDQKPADPRNIDDWIRELPRVFRDVDEGVMKDLMLIALRYFEEVRLAAVNHQGAVSMQEMLRHQQKLSLFTDGDSDLDRRLIEAPTVREPFVSNLTALVLVLSTGIKLFTPEHRQTLVEDTNRVLEQASKVALVHLHRSLSCSPIDILEYLDAIKIEIESRMDNLYDLLPTTRHLVENSDETEPQQVEEIGLDKHRPFDTDKHIKRLRQDIRQLLSGARFAGDSSSASRRAEKSRRALSHPSRSSTKQSSGSTASTSIPSLFPDNGTHGSVHPLTDTITSTSPSEAKNSNSEPTNSNSTQASSICKDCSTTFSDPAALENHPCHTHRIKRFYHRVVQPVIKHCLPFSARMSQHIFESDQLVIVWHRDGQRYTTCVASVDTGTDENLISHSLVKELDHGTTRKFPMTLTSFGHTFEVSESVQPIWKFSDDSRRHQEFSFFVVPEIDGQTGMVLGNIARKEMGIDLRKRALIASEDWKDLPTQEREQKQRERQARDTTASQIKTRQMIEARRAELRQKAAAANASRNTKLVNPTSKKDASGSGDVQ